VAYDNSLGLHRIKITNYKCSYTTSPRFLAALCTGHRCIFSGCGDSAQSEELSTFVLQQEDVFVTPSIIRVCERDVWNNRGSKEIMLVLIRPTLQNIHK